MLTKDILVNSATFRREGFKKFTEVSMSRRYIKNALFLVLVVGLSISVYTAFLGTKKGVRSGLQGFVQNMAVEQGGFKDDAHKPVDNHDENHKVPHHEDHPDPNFQATEARPEGRNPTMKPDVDVKTVEEQWGWFPRLWGNDKKEESNTPEPFKDLNVDKAKAEEEAKYREASRARARNKIHQIDPKDIEVKDRKGNFVGYRLFPNGIQPYNNMPAEQKLRELRKRLGLPPIPERFTNPPERKEMVEPHNFGPKQIINLDGDPHEPERVDNLGAFRLKDKDDMPIDQKPKKIIDLDGDPNEPQRVDNLGAFRLKNNNEIQERDFHRLNDMHGVHNNAYDRHMDDGRMAHQANPFNADNNPMPDHFGPRNDLHDRGFNDEPNVKKRFPIIRPIGDHGVNPFHLEQKRARQNGMITGAPDINNRYPVAQNVNNGRESFLQNKNRFDPFQPDVARNDPSKNNLVNPFQDRKIQTTLPNPTQINRGFNPLQDSRHDIGNDDLLRNFQTTTRIESQLTQDYLRLNGGNVKSTKTLDSAANAFQGGNQEAAEPDLPLHIEDLNKPLPVEMDCISYLFPPKPGTLCIDNKGHDKAMSDVISSTGMWEPEMLAEFFSILKSHPDLSVVDIGAGIGVYTLTAAMMGREVMAVEPLYLNYRFLHKSALENGVSSRITLVANAIGSENYQGFLHYSDDAGGYSQTQVERLSDTEAISDSSKAVQVTTLDSLVQALLFKTAVMKIDVGGIMEADVLKTSSKFFGAVKIPYIITHWNSKMDISKKIELIGLMTQLGYRPQHRWNGEDAKPDDLKENLRYLTWLSRAALA